MTGTLVAICAVHIVHEGHSRAGRTAIDKRALAGPVRIGGDGVEGDTQIEHMHGGRYQALYAYAREEAARWAGELGEDVPPGRFGENVVTSGIAVTDAVVGERWLIGSTVVVETTTPRIPCFTFQSWMGQPSWVKRFGDRGDVGCYLRVVTPGLVRAGDPIAVLSRPAHGVTIRDVFTAADQDPSRLRRLLDEAHDLAPKAQNRVSKALAAHAAS